MDAILINIAYGVTGSLIASFVIFAGKKIYYRISTKRTAQMTDG